MARYIDAELLKKNIRVNFMPNVDVDGTVTVENAERYFLNLIDKTSSADVEEVKHGHWVRNSPNPELMKIFHNKGIAEGMSEKSIFWTCSECGIWGSRSGKRCSHCGAKMDGGKA